VLLAAARRVLLLLVLASAVTSAVALLIGALAGISVGRSLALGFYFVGSFLLVAGFFIGNRGPVRVKSETAGGTPVPFPLFGNRRLRWATREEHHEVINQSAVFVTLGLVLLVIGILVDSRYQLF
jgi:hypothetical protein